MCNNFFVQIKNVVDYIIVHVYKTSNYYYYYC
jgi:hypothetical protein